MKRTFAMALAVIMLLCSLPLTAFAAETDGQSAANLGMADIGSAGYQTMTTSQEMLDILKMVEGFSAEPYWDVSQWTVGYGSFAGSYSQSNKPSITFERSQAGYDAAEALMKEQLASFEAKVNNFCRKIGKQPSQNQFDALVDFTYNLGDGWMSGSTLASWLKEPTTEMDFVNAIGQWVRADGEILFGLCQRRIREAIIFLKGEYYAPVPYENRPELNVKTNLRVVSNGALPYYKSVIYQFDHGALKGKGDKVAYFADGGVYDSLAIPTTREGYIFTGWKITRINGTKTDIGGMVVVGTTVENNVELTAQWEVDPNAPPVEDDTTTPPVDSDTTVDSTNPDTDTTPSEPVVVTNPFTDVAESDYYYEAVLWAYSTGVTTGTTATTFSPDATCTRAQVVTFLWRAMGEPEPTTTNNPFVDVAANQYYYKAVLWAVENGITNGMDATHFGPDVSCNRAQVATFLWRAEGQSAPSSTVNPFVDVAEGQYYYTAVLWAVENGITNGMDATHFSPSAVCSRAQIVTFLYRDLMG